MRQWMKSPAFVSFVASCAGTLLVLGVSVVFLHKRLPSVGSLQNPIAIVGPGYPLETIQPPPPKGVPPLPAPWPSSAPTPPWPPGHGVSSVRPSIEGSTVIGGGLYFRVTSDETIELIDYNRAATSTMMIPGARTIRILPADYLYGVSIILATEHALYQAVFANAYSQIKAEIKKIADTDTTGAKMLNDTIIIVPSGAYSRTGKIDAVKDPLTLRELKVDPAYSYGQIFYADKEHVYVPRHERDSGPTFLIAMYDAPTFVVFPQSRYVKDKNGAYFEKGKLLNADPGSFTVIDSPKLAPMKGDGARYPYAKDKNHVYFNGVALSEADPATFVAVSEKGGTYLHPYGKDLYRVYFNEHLLQGADPDTFEVLWNHVYEGCGPGQYAKDKNQVYFMGRVLEGADTKTFEALRTISKDKHGFWEGGFLRPDITEEPVCNYG